MSIKKVKKELNLTNKIIAGFFGLSLSSYKTSSAKKRYEEALIRIYNYIKAEDLM